MGRRIQLNSPRSFAYIQGSEKDIWNIGVSSAHGSSSRTRNWNAHEADPLQKRALFNAADLDA